MNPNSEIIDLKSLGANNSDSARSSQNGKEVAPPNTSLTCVEDDDLGSLTKLICLCEKHISTFGTLVLSIQ